MSVIDDKETLELLKKANNKNLECYILLEDLYKRHNKYTPEDLLKEICLDGSNTIASIFRGWTPVHYDEVVRDVAEKIGVKDENIDKDNMQKNEIMIIGKLIEDFWKNLSEQERDDIINNIHKLKDIAVNPKSLINLLKLGGNIVPILISKIGIKATQQVVLKVLGSMLTRQAVIQGTRTILGMLIPVVNILMGIWLLVDIAGPAYRKTIPSVVSIAMIRLQLESEE